MTGGAVHQGLAARLPAYEYAHADDLLERAAEAKEPVLVVALDSVTDPRNLGAVVRSAAGFGAHGVLIPERRAAGMTASAWKTSAGAAARLPIAQTVNLTRQLKAYQDAGCMVVGLAADGDISLPELVAPGGLAEGPLVVVVGLRGQGPRPARRRDLRPDRLDPDGRPARVAQRRRGRIGRPLRDLAGPLVTDGAQPTAAARRRRAARRQRGSRARRGGVAVPQQQPDRGAGRPRHRRTPHAGARRRGRDRAAAARPAVPRRRPARRDPDARQDRGRVHRGAGASATR